ncbi:MAG TPA: metallopeptidase TldD-related protein [Anaerolineaceae bacterium]
MKERILQTLRDLRQYALTLTQGKEVVVSLYYHEEDSYLMRFANSAISLNTNEHLIRLEISANEGQKRASIELITNLDQVNEMKQGIDNAVEMVRHVQPLTYLPTLPAYTETFIDESALDPELSQLSNAEKLAFFNQAAAGLETEEIRLSGIFACGTNIIAMINTRSEHLQYFASTDAQINLVLSHSKLKWEVTAEQSAQKKADLNPQAMHNELALLLDHYQHDEPVQIPLGKYDIVFGAIAIANLVSFMNWIGFNGGLMRRGFSFITEDQVGKQVLSSQFTLADDPGNLETFPFKRDFMGMDRKRFPIFDKGVFKGFLWMQDDADEFGMKPTGHTVVHNSLVLEGGEMEVVTLEELLRMPREKDLLYVPFLHYMNIVNPSKGVITGSSRFGALLLKKDGSVAVPYNVRLTQSLPDIFGEKVAWLSKATVAQNLSHSYGARNPVAMIVPRFMRVNDLEISHSNASY